MIKHIFSQLLRFKRVIERMKNGYCRAYNSAQRVNRELYIRRPVAIPGAALRAGILEFSLAAAILLELRAARSLVSPILASSGKDPVFTRCSNLTLSTRSISTWKTEGINYHMSYQRSISVTLKNTTYGRTTSKSSRGGKVGLRLGPPTLNQLF